MKIRITNLYNVMAASLLSLLGFSSCDSDGGGDEPLLYGTPTAAYKIKGKVIDADGKPINGLKVGADLVYGDNRDPLEEPVYTDENGEYSTTVGGFPIGAPGKGTNLEITFEDVDGEDNGGTFANDTIKQKDMTIKQVEKGDGAWNNGTFEVTANKTLKRK